MKSPTSKRLDNLHPEVFDCWCLMVLIPCVIAEGHVLQSTGILQYHARPGGSITYGCHD